MKRRPGWKLKYPFLEYETSISILDNWEDGLLKAVILYEI